MTPPFSESQKVVTLPLFPPPPPHSPPANFWQVPKGIRISESGKIVLVKSRIQNPECGKILILEPKFLGFEIPNTAKRIWNPTKSKFHRRRLESSTRNLDSTAWNQESNWLSWTPLHEAKSYWSTILVYCPFSYFLRIKFNINSVSTGVTCIWTNWRQLYPCLA